MGEKLLCCLKKRKGFKLTIYLPFFIILIFFMRECDIDITYITVTKSLPKPKSW